MPAFRYASQEAANIRRASQEAVRQSALNSSIAQRKAEETAANGYEPAITASDASHYFRGNKSWAALNKDAVGLGSVDNTADADKPVSIAQSTALSGKMDAFVAAPASPSSTGSAGQMAYDASWLYVCTATNTWVRSALATWV